MKKFLFVLHVMILFTATVQAAEPVRIARLPIIFQSNVPDSETCAELETKIKRAIHIPLNGTLQLAEYLPEENSAHVLNDIWQGIQNKKTKLADVMRPLATELDADIIVCPVLNQYIQYESIGFRWDGEIYINSYVEAELIVYDRRTDELIDKKASQFYHDVYSTTGTASYLSKICFDKVIDAGKLRQLIHDIR